MGARGTMIVEMLNNIYVVVTLIIALLIVLVVLSICIRFKLLGKGKQRLKIDIGNAQIIGTREKQDDSFATTIKDYGLFAVVADGIGGYINGNLASRIAVDTYMNEFEKNDVTANISYFFQRTARLANEGIKKEFGDVKGGTTVVNVVVQENLFYWSSVGDSSIAIFRDKRLIPINKKENVKTWLEEQYLAGMIGREAALAHPHHKRLVNYIGYDGFKKADESDKAITIKKKDKILLFSDGVETLSQIELEEILSKRGSANKLTENIMKAIERKNVMSKDNATIILLSVK